MTRSLHISNWRTLFLLPGTLFTAFPSASTSSDKGCRFEGDLVTITSVRHSFYDLHRRACGGDPNAQLELAHRYHTGDGLPKSARDAAHWYQRAAYQGVPEAEFQLGSMYLEGVGVSEDSVAALRWISRAAKHDHPHAKVLYDYILTHDEALDC